MPDEYVAPECKWDFPAAYRAEILSDVILHGETDRCSADLSNAFAGWEHSQINDWCAEHGLAIIARHDGRIVICRATGERLRSHGVTVTDQYEMANDIRISAEVEAMDWPEVIGE
jgi:hypothetical protein